MKHSSIAQLFSIAEREEVVNILTRPRPAVKSRFKRNVFELSCYFYKKKHVISIKSVLLSLKYALKWSDNIVALFQNQFRHIPPFLSRDLSHLQFLSSLLFL